MMDTTTTTSCTSILQLYIQKLKIATAIAIIRMAPSGTSPEEYAAHLGAQVLQHSDVWVMKSPEVEKLIYSLEQSFCLESQQSLDFSGNILDKLPCSQNKCYDLVPSTSNHQTLSDSIVPSNNFVVFMNSVLYLKSITSSSQPCMEDPEWLHSISESLGKLFRHLRSETGSKMPIIIAEKAIKVIHDLFGLKNKVLAELLVDACLFFVDSLIFDIINTIDINMFGKQHRFSSLMQIMAQHLSLTITILSRLMQTIIDFHKSLVNRNTMDVYKLSSVVAVENIYFIFQTLEGIFYSVLKPENIRTLSLPKNVGDAWQCMIGEIVDNTSVNLPVFYTYLFQVHSIIIATFKL